VDEEINRMDETLTVEEAKLLIEYCRAGKLYEVEKWIASGKSIKVTLLLRAENRRKVASKSREEQLFSDAH
jgi:hypothetical protein